MKILSGGVLMYDEHQNLKCNNVDEVILFVYIQKTAQDGVICRKQR